MGSAAAGASDSGGCSPREAVARPAAAPAARARQGRGLQRCLRPARAGARPEAMAAGCACRGCGLRMEGAVQGRVEGAL